jgi:hypothetical protein
MFSSIFQLFHLFISKA